MASADLDDPPFASFRRPGTSQNTPNPYRPYYIPPSIGLPPDAASHGPNGTASGRPFSKMGKLNTARSLLSDLDYGDYLPEGSPSLAEMAKRFMDQAVWNYTSVLMAQPFEVAKTVLQVHLAGSADEESMARMGTPGSRHVPSYNGRYQDFIPSDDDDSDNDSPSYFTSTTPESSRAYSRPDMANSRSNSNMHGRRPSQPSTPSRSSQFPGTSGSRAPSQSSRLQLSRPDALIPVLTQLWGKESAWGLWKATNTAFVYNILLKTIESWTRSFLSALFNISDPGTAIGVGAIGEAGIRIAHSAHPWLSLGVAVAAAGVAGVILSPLDIIRSRRVHPLIGLVSLILTPHTSPPRNLLPSLASLPTFVVPTAILPITFLHSAIPPLLTASSPMVLRSTLSIDPVLSPTSFSVATFVTQVAELFIRLPLETVLRRGHAHVLKDWSLLRSPASDDRYKSFRKEQSGRPSKEEKLDLIITPGPYRGVLGTMWYIAREEGVRIKVASPSVAKKGPPGKPLREPKKSKGQGMSGLWRGWRAGFWGLVGVWGAAALGGGGGEF
ncbi:hypothetical protein P152DRAFT_405943 [Eremomyces bilateralis CBS 781.70]|uniref:Mitochondrial carrier n=1 Tax=Eremomyces bilateralis CBS 781.70 TaxID=1392243 RepID=A0A6G1FR07_9PEZI|nr:uncharacterized protein P152DRAFT_405943 [Eremomyces bilateralis CBS 781.70]KAF1808224.1 hypothetical protein P152DRAFT_405943 [Eremomyces bilateralis CBS 781.70]